MGMLVFAIVVFVTVKLIIGLCRGIAREQRRPEMAMRCSRPGCGAVMPASAKFCARCGMSLRGTPFTGGDDFGGGPFTRQERCAQRRIERAQRRAQRAEERALRRVERAFSQ